MIFQIHLLYSFLLFFLYINNFQNMLKLKYKFKIFHLFYIQSRAYNIYMVVVQTLCHLKNLLNKQILLKIFNIYQILLNLLLSYQHPFLQNFLKNLNFFLFFISILIFNSIQNYLMNFILIIITNILLMNPLHLT